MNSLTVSSNQHRLSSGFDPDRELSPVAGLDTVAPIEWLPSVQPVHLPFASSRVKLVVASSVMLTFISFWRAAAVVLNDLGSSAFYAGGIAEEAVGKSAPGSSWA